MNIAWLDCWRVIKVFRASVSLIIEYCIGLGTGCPASCCIPSQHGDHLEDDLVGWRSAELWARSPVLLMLLL